MKSHRKKHFFSFCILFFTLWQVHENSLIEVNIPVRESEIKLVMRLKDKRDLEYLFYKMFIRDDGGYTLFGAKPMHMNVYLNPFVTSNWEDFHRALSLDYLRTYRGLKAFQKYQYLLENSNFILLSEKNPFLEEHCQKLNKPNFGIAIILINRERLKEVFDKHKKDFQIVLEDDDISCESILKEMKYKHFLKEILKNHNGLIGTVFGYGRDNAWLFLEKHQGHIVHSWAPVWGHDVYEFFQNRPSFSWQWFGYCSNELPKLVGYPTFFADPNSVETQELKEKFLETRQKIIDYYKEKKFFEATLNILMN